MSQPTPPNGVANDGVKDFTIRLEPHRFRIDDDEFAAPALMAPYTLKRLAGLHSQLGDLGSLMASGEDGVDKALSLVVELFRVMLPGSSGRRFTERLMSDGNPGEPDADPPIPPSPLPIDLTRQAMPVLRWLMERYGLRPTVPSSVSLPGSTDGTTDTPSAGISSTAGVSPTETEITSPV